MMVSNPKEAPMRISKLAVSAVVISGALLSTMRWTLARSVAPEQQLGAQDTTTRISAALLRRLAAAADGYRTGLPVWVVVSTYEPYQVEGVYTTLAEARLRICADVACRPDDLYAGVEPNLGLAPYSLADGESRQRGNHGVQPRRDLERLHSREC